MVTLLHPFSFIQSPKPARGIGELPFQGAGPLLAEPHASFALLGGITCPCWLLPPNIFGSRCWSPVAPPALHILVSPHLLGKCPLSFLGLFGEPTTWASPFYTFWGPTVRAILPTKTHAPLSLLDSPFSKASPSAPLWLFSPLPALTTCLSPSTG